MHGMFRVSALLLIVAALGAQAFAFATVQPAVQNDRSATAGCHESVPAVPSQRPVSHECCVSGHSWAIPAVAFTAGDIASCVGGDYVADISLDSSFSDDLVAVIVPSYSPPGIAPLRI